MNAKGKFVFLWALFIIGATIPLASGQDAIPLEETAKKMCYTVAQSDTGGTIVVIHNAPGGDCRHEIPAADMGGGKGGGVAGNRKDGDHTISIQHFDGKIELVQWDRQPVPLLAGQPGKESGARRWTDSTGKYTVEAEFVGFKDGKVQLKKEDGKTITVPIDKLSEADQEFMHTLKPTKESGDENRPANDNDRAGVKAALAADQVEVTRIVRAQNVLQGDVTIQPKSNKKFLWVEISVGELSRLPVTLDLMAVKLKDASGQKQKVLGLGLGKRTDDKPSIDYFLGTPDSVVASGPFAGMLSSSMTTEGPSVGKVHVEIDTPGKKANVTFQKVPSTMCLLFVVPTDSGEMSLTNVFGKTLSLKADGGK